MKLDPQKGHVMRSFKIEVPAKWVLMGEHSVLRGREAIAFPHAQMKLSLNYQPGQTIPVTANPFQSQIRSLVGRASEFLNMTLDIQENAMEIHSQIPIGAGLGSSAALCVAMAKFALWKAQLKEDQLVPLATHLEHLYHGKSSGMDVSAIAAGSSPILYSIDQGASLISPLGTVPRFELYDSGKRGSTKECIQKVKHWQQSMPHLVEHYDDQMNDATRLAHQALLNFSMKPRESEDQLAIAMTLGQKCFETWGLVSPDLIEQKHDLLKQGALAVKLTGAGLGGFWIALWRS
jgi:mevalonate kinase